MSINLNFKFNYLELRGFHICCVFGLTLLIQELFNFPRSGWTGFAVMTIYAGFDMSTTISRAFQRFWGMLLGLISGYFLWFLGHMDYRSLIILLPMTIFFAYFLAGKSYSTPTIFTVNGAVIGTGFFANSIDLAVSSFLIDYSICTLIALIIILLCEYFWFSRYRVSHLFIQEKQALALKELHFLFQLLNQRQIYRTQWFYGCIALNRSLGEINNLVHQVKLIDQTRAVKDDEAYVEFVTLSSKVFEQLKALYCAYLIKGCKQHQPIPIYIQVQHQLQLLQKMVPGAKFLGFSAKEIYANNP
jgi:hypothetical protein